MIPLLAAAVAALVAAPAAADVSVYPYPQPVPTGGPYEGWQAYDPTQLQDPPLPAADQQPNLNFQVTLDTSGQATGAGIELEGSFMGVSIEMSLAEAIIGPNATWLRPQFLNLMSMLKERGGPPVLRLGGNTQEKAELVDSLPGGASLDKIAIGPTGYTNTPTLMYTLDILKALRATSDLLGIRWFLGIPMNQTYRFHDATVRRNGLRHAVTSSVRIELRQDAADVVNPHPRAPTGPDSLKLRCRI